MFFCFCEDDSGLSGEGKQKNRPGRRKERLTMLLDRRIETGSRSINVFGVPPPEARNHKSSGNGILLTECRNIVVLTDRACCGFRPFRDELLIKFGIYPFYRACKRGRNGIFGQKRSVFMRKMTGHFMSDSPSFLAGCWDMSEKCPVIFLNRSVLPRFFFWNPCEK